MPETKDRGAPKAYTVTAKSFHDGRLYRGGETIMLYDDEVGPHHALIVPPEPEAPQLSASPVKVKRARKPKAPVAAPAPEPAPVKPKGFRRPKWVAVTPPAQEPANTAPAPKPTESPKRRDRKAKPLA